jgi:hypothetical protein
VVPEVSVVVRAGDAQVGPLDLADLTDAGWLGRLTALSGAPVTLVPNFVTAPALTGGALDGVDVFELDAFAVATVYGTVVLDDRAWQWHGDAGRPDSAQLLRAIHDLAVRAYRNHDAGERLQVVRV